MSLRCWAEKKPSYVSSAEVQHFQFRVSVLFQKSEVFLRNAHYLDSEGIWALLVSSTFQVLPLNYGAF